MLYVIGGLAFVSITFHLINCLINESPVFPLIHSYSKSKEMVYGRFPITLSFQQFRKFYAIAPNKWDKCKYCWEYAPGKSRSCIYVSGSNLIEYLKIYFWWKRTMRHNKSNKKKMDEMREKAKLLEYIKEDAKMAEQEAERMIHAQEQEINNILNCLGVKATGSQ